MIMTWSTVVVEFVRVDLGSEVVVEREGEQKGTAKG
jgi:hypothetical protein